MWTDAQAPPSYFEPKPLDATQVDSPAPETPVTGVVPPAMSTPPAAPTIPSPTPAAPTIPSPEPPAAPTIPRSEPPAIIPSQVVTAPPALPAVAAPVVPTAPLAPEKEHSRAPTTAAPNKSAPPPFVAPSSGGATPTELEDDMNESASNAGTQPATSGRDPSYWKLRRYFKPKTGGALKCSPEAMKMWQTSEGRFWVRFVCAIDCAGFATI